MASTPSTDRPRLRTLAPRLAQANLSRVTELQAPKPGATERPRGRAWMEQRERVMKRDNYLCVHCRRKDVIRAATEVDHRVPLEKGGSNDDANLDGICSWHHRAKTAAEASARAAGTGGVGRS